MRMPSALLQRRERRDLLDSSIALLRGRRAGALAIFLFAIAAAYILAGWIVAGSLDNLLFATAVIIAGAISLATLRNWRMGVYLFIAWLLFEDLFRKYMGNNMLIFFGKDALIGMVYLSFFLAWRRKKTDSLRLSFRLPFGLFFWLGVIQVLNPASPHLVYGLLGLKVYFFYVPLLFIGYAMFEEEEDLNKFFVFNMRLAMVIAVLGIIQAIRGPEFLNPGELDRNIRALSSLTRYSPITHSAVYRPNSVFVSEGRFSAFLILMWLISFGAAGYSVLRNRPGRNFTFLTLGALTVALALHGSRGGIMWTGGSALVAIAAFLWGSSRKQRQARRMLKVIRNGCLICGIGLIGMMSAFPKELGARWSLYSETLMPDSPAYELSNRIGQYPWQNFLITFTSPRWPYGYGIGTTSLGAQYVAQWTHIPALAVGVESGFGTLVVELGIMGLVLWFAWTITLLISAFRVVRSLKRTPYFPIAFSIFWFAFLLLLPFTYTGMQAYQNYVMNAYLWILLGILFRLPHLAAQQPQEPARARAAHL